VSPLTTTLPHRRLCGSTRLLRRAVCSWPADADHGVVVPQRSLTQAPALPDHRFGDPHPSSLLHRVIRADCVLQTGSSMPAVGSGDQTLPFGALLCRVSVGHACNCVFDGSGCRLGHTLLRGGATERSPLVCLGPFRATHPSLGRSRHRPQHAYSLAQTCCASSWPALVRACSACSQAGVDRPAAVSTRALCC